MPKTAVVILNYNGRSYLETFLPTLISKTQNAEIIVADNQSTDDSVNYLKTIEGVRCIELPENYGYAGGYNAALSQIEAEYYVLVNSDIEVTDGWLEPLVHFLDEHPDYYAAQPKILDQKNRQYFEYAGAAGGFVDALGYPYCRGRIFDTIEEDQGQYDDAADIFWASGACFIIRSEIYHLVKGLDADFFAHMEEIDLCWRIKSLGGKLKYIPDSKVFHVGGGTLNKTNPKKTYLNFRNGIFLLIKNLPLFHLAWILPVRILMDWLASIKFMIDNKTLSHPLAILKAHFHSLIKFSENFRKRSKPISTGTNKVITWNYFVLGRKKYNDL